MYPNLQTEKLILRKFNINDAPDVKNLAGDIAVSDTCLLPHPYSIEMAEDWINSLETQFKEKKYYIWALTLIDAGELIGCIGLHSVLAHNKAELGYWLGKNFWNKGYVSQAINEVVRYGFMGLNLNKIYSQVFTRNIGSIRVLEKNKFIQEAFLKKHVHHFNKYEDIFIYSMLQEEFYLL